MNTRMLSTALALSIATAAMVALPACESSRERVQMTGPSLTITPTQKKVYAGEIVTVTTHTTNLLSREAEIRWSTTGGQLNTQENGRIARVQFDKPGTYVVSAQLFVNGDMTQTDSVTINVLPLR